MKKKLFNSTTIEGLLYEHNLETRVTGSNSKNPGTEYIRGTISIATDNALTNIVQVNYTYVTPTNKSGQDTRYVELKKIMDGTYGSVMDVGSEKATKLRITSSIGLNEFYSDRNGTEELVSVKRNDSGFIRAITELNSNEAQRASFDVDIVITGVNIVEADEERKLPEKAIVKGAIFGYPAKLLPVEFSAVAKKAIAYFEDCGATPKTPVFTRIKGTQVSETVVRQITEESAFGEPEVREVTSSRKDWVITWAQPETYVWDDEGTMTAQELADAMAARQIELATMKQRNDEWKASRSVAAMPTSNTKKTTTSFDF